MCNLINTHTHTHTPLADTRQLRSQGLVPVHAHRTEGVTGSGRSEWGWGRDRSRGREERRWKRSWRRERGRGRSGNGIGTGVVEANGNMLFNTLGVTTPQASPPALLIPPTACLDPLRFTGKSFLKEFFFSMAHSSLEP